MIDSLAQSILITTAISNFGYSIIAPFLPFQLQKIKFKNLLVRLHILNLFFCCDCKQSIYTQTDPYFRKKEFDCYWHFLDGLHLHSIWATLLYIRKSNTFYYAPASKLISSRVFFLLNIDFIVFYMHKLLSR